MRFKLPAVFFHFNLADLSTTKVLSRELFLGVVALKTPIQKNHYMRDMGPFPRYCHIYMYVCICSLYIVYMYVIYSI